MLQHIRELNSGRALFAKARMNVLSLRRPPTCPMEGTYCAAGLRAEVRGRWRTAAGAAGGALPEAAGTAAGATAAVAAVVGATSVVAEDAPTSSRAGGAATSGPAAAATTVGAVTSAGAATSAAAGAAAGALPLSSTRARCMHCDELHKLHL